MRRSLCRYKLCYKIPFGLPDLSQKAVDGENDARLLLHDLDEPFINKEVIFAIHLFFEESAFGQL